MRVMESDFFVLESKRKNVKSGGYSLPVVVVLVCGGVETTMVVFDFLFLKKLLIHYYVFVHI